MSPYPITDHRLDNGLRVVVCPDHTAPVVAVNLWYDVGSRHEALDLTGFAHLFEHLMFQGSANVGPSEHFALLQAVGGSLNGTTSFDRTNYFETVPSHALDLALWLEADRMGGLLEALTQENLDNQREVVKNERRQRYDNVPYGTAFERLFALGFPPGHPYHHLPIGSMEHLDAASLEDARSFFRTYYAPDNATLAVVGDVAPDAALSAVEHYFGGIPAYGGAPPPRDGRIGPIEERVTEEVREDVPAEAIYALFRTPADGLPEADAADLACRVLSEGASSRLQSRLVRRDQTAQALRFGVQPLVGGVGSALLAVHARSGASLVELEAALDEELARFAAEGPTEAELERAKAQAERSFLDNVSTAEGLADELSRHATLFDDPHGVSRVVERIAAVTAEQVRAVAAEHLEPQRRAQLTYRPAA